MDAAAAELARDARVLTERLALRAPSRGADHTARRPLASVSFAVVPPASAHPAPAQPSHDSSLGAGRAPTAYTVGASTLFRNRDWANGRDVHGALVSAPVDPYVPRSMYQSDFCRGPASAFEGPRIFFILGGPGSGKGTACAHLVERFGFTHLSSGDLLRAEAERAGSAHGDVIRRCMAEGTLVPDEITIALLRAAIAARPNPVGFLLDGFPRSLQQAELCERELALPAGILYFGCTDAVLEARLLGRAATSGRADDNRETIAKRLATFHAVTEPLLEYFGERVALIDASGTIGRVAELACCAVEARGVRARL